MCEHFELEPTVDLRFVAYARRLSEAWFVVALDSKTSGTTLHAQYQWLAQTLRRDSGSRAQPEPAHDQKNHDATGLVAGSGCAWLAEFVAKCLRQPC